jgi:hypothetical protein
MPGKRPFLLLAALAMASTFLHTANLDLAPVAAGLGIAGGTEGGFAFPPRLALQAARPRPLAGDAGTPAGAGQSR